MGVSIATRQIVNVAKFTSIFVFFVFVFVLILILISFNGVHNTTKNFPMVNMGRNSDMTVDLDDPFEWHG